MIKITLKNGTMAETDNPKEAMELLKLLQGSEGGGVAENGSEVDSEPINIYQGGHVRVCKFCGKPLPKYHKTLCGDPVCMRRAASKSSKRYYKKLAKQKEVEKATGDMVVNDLDAPKEAVVI
jgi:hypothetical protein